MSEASKKKIAILGGGIAALTTAFELTEQPDWNDHYEITVYQLGWRLGGKGASGRNREEHDRIEEHGLHVWWGFYDNAFNLMQRCYHALNRPADEPLSTWRDAFKPHNLVVLMEQVNGDWVPWTVDPPGNDDIPGSGDAPSLWDYLYRGVEWMLDIFVETRRSQADSAAETLPSRSSFDWLGGIIEDIEERLEEVLWSVGRELLENVLRLVEAVGGFSDDPDDHGDASHNVIVALLERFNEWLWERVEDEVEDNDVTRRLWVYLNFGYANICGALRDKVIFNGFNTIDEHDYRDWLKQHGASDLTLESALVRGFYDAAFAHVNGEIDQPQVAAGTALRGVLRLAFGYKGAVLWKMQAGMGDAVFTPLYEVLKARGVKFKFFHRVKNLGLSDDKKSVETITIARQVTLKNPEYNPLVPIDGLPCWPDRPDYDQIVDNERQTLIDDDIALESFWTPWTDAEELTLTVGTHFDQVVLGISLGALPYICPELIDANSDWDKMVKNVKTIQTQSFQLWLKPTLEELGWRLPKPVLSGFVDPLDTWADMTHLLPMESWLAGEVPKNLSYFCGVMAGPDEIPPPTDHQFPQQEMDKAKANAIEYLKKHLGVLCSNVVSDNDPDHLWNLLIDSADRDGQQRFDAQFWRANVNPSDRYVISVPGSTKFRLKSDESGFDNLYLAGDWTDNGLNIGCIEAAVMSGMGAARSISGRDIHIFGESDF